MRTFIKKFLVLLFVIMTVTGCSKKSSTQNPISTALPTSTTETSKNTVETSKPKNKDNSDVQTKAERENTKKEDYLSISTNNKQKYIEEFGKDGYQHVLDVCYYALRINTNSQISSDWLDSYKKDYDVYNLRLKSSLDGHKIPADFITQKSDKTNDTVILVHGKDCNRTMNMYMGETLLKMGYNILTLDLRNSGENKARLTTYGIWEKYDIYDCGDYIKKQIGNNQRIFLWGGSYGGCVVANTIGTEKANELFSGAILDCPLSAMEAYFGVILSNHAENAKEDVSANCNTFMKEMYDFSIEDADGTINIAKTKMPVAIFASEEDGLVPTVLPQSLYDSVKGEKYIKIFKTSGHCLGLEEHPKQYKAVINKILKHK